MWMGCFLCAVGLDYAGLLTLPKRNDPGGTRRVVVVVVVIRVRKLMTFILAATIPPCRVKVNAHVGQHGLLKVMSDKSYLTANPAKWAKKTVKLCEPGILSGFIYHDCNCHRDFEKALCRAS